VVIVKLSSDERQKLWDQCFDASEDALVTFWHEQGYLPYDIDSIATKFHDRLLGCALDHFPCGDIADISHVIWTAVDEALYNYPMGS